MSTTGSGKVLAKAATIASIAEIVPARPVHVRNRAPSRAGGSSTLTSGHVDLDAAVHHAHRALDLAVTVQSSRCTQAITNLRARIQPTP